MSKPEGYQEVAERIHSFYQRHPQGSIRTEAVEFVQVGGKDFVLVKAAVYRTPDDPVPGTGTAMEPIPGSTPFTRGSEVENGETSAWGRALASLGLGGRKIATADEVATKTTGRTAGFTPKPRADVVRDLAVKKGLGLEQIIGLLEPLAQSAAPQTAQGKRVWVTTTIDALNDLQFQQLQKDLAA